MAAVAVFVISAITFRDFWIYYWRTTAAEAS
jgi:hypothetical protein